MQAARRRSRPWSLVVAGPVALDTVCRSHGWVGLVPFRTGESAVLSTTCLLDGTAVDLDLEAHPDGVEVTVHGQTRTAGGQRELKATVRRMLQMDRDLTDFWQRCRRHQALRWVARRQAGRMLCAPTLFEDLAKILLTTNCAWSSTVSMTARLVELLGPAAASGRKAFPDPATCASQPASFYRDEVRAGYRAESLAALARRFADGSILVERWQDPETPEDVLREELLGLPGFGPYAAGQGLRLLGRGRDLALDSWCRARWAELHGRRRPAADRTIERTVRPFRPDQGLALWMWLTGEWYGETTRPWRSPS